MKLSATVVTYNEASNIERCLKSLSFCDEIIIVDSRSTDKTVQIAKKHTKKIYFAGFTGFSEIKNLAVKKAKGEWVLSVDADEEVPGELKEKILEITRSRGAADGYYIKRADFFLGREIKHCGWDKDYQLRLFRREKGMFDGKTVHEAVEVDGATLRIEEPLYHYSYPDKKTYFLKMERYTSLQAKEKQRSFALLRMVFAPVLKFTRMYILKAGFLDGMQGYLLSLYSAYSEFVKFSKMRVEKIRKKAGDNIVIKAPNWIGDAVMMTAFLPALKKAYKKVIIAASGDGVKTVLEGSPYIDEIIVYDRKNFLSTIAAAAKLRKEGVGTGISFSPSLSSYLLLLLAGARLRFGYASDMGWMFLSRAYKQDRGHKREHVSEEYKKILLLANDYLDFTGARQSLYIDPVFEKQVLKRFRIPHSAFRILIAPFAKFGPSKMWPLEFYSGLIKGLLKKYKKAVIYVTGLEEDKSFNLGEDINRDKRFVDMRGVGLKEVTAVAKNVGLFIGNDSGIMHIADAFEIPMAVIFGATPPGWGGPLQSKTGIFYEDLECQPCFNKSCKYGHYECLRKIKPEDVMKGIGKLIK